MKIKFYCVLILINVIYIHGISQNDSSKIIPPPAPNAPFFQMELSKGEKKLLKRIEKSNQYSKEEEKIYLDTLSKIVLNKNSFYWLRMEAVNSISKVQSDEAKLFLFQYIDLYVYSQTFSDKAFFIENIPVYEAFIKVENFDLYKYLFKEKYLEECHNQNKLKLLERLMRRNYGKELALKMLEEELSKASNKCVKYNIEYMLKKLKAY